MVLVVVSRAEHDPLRKVNHGHEGGGGLTNDAVEGRFVVVVVDLVADDLGNVSVKAASGYHVEVLRDGRERWGEVGGGRRPSQRLGCIA